MIYIYMYVFDVKIYNIDFINSTSLWAIFPIKLTVMFMILINYFFIYKIYLIQRIVEQSNF